MAVLPGTLGGASAGPASLLEAWRVVKSGQTAGAGQLAIVGSTVKSPGSVAIRAVVAKPRSITVAVVMSCRKGPTTRVGQARLTGVGPYTKPLPLPLAGADNCAVSGTAKNPIRAADARAAAQLIAVHGR